MSETTFEWVNSHVQCFCNHFVMHGVWNKWPQASLYASDPILCPSRHMRHSLLDSSSRSSTETYTRGRLRIAELLAGGDFPAARAATSGTISRASAMTSLAVLTPFLTRMLRHGNSVESYSLKRSLSVTETLCRQLLHIPHQLPTTQRQEVGSVRVFVRLIDLLISGRREWKWTLVD